MARTKTDAEVLTLNILHYLIQNPEALATFLSTSGCSPKDLRDEIKNESFRAGLMDYFLEHSELITEFLQTYELSAQDFMDIRLSLKGGADAFKGHDIIMPNF